MFESLFESDYSRYVPRVFSLEIGDIQLLVKIVKFSTIFIVDLVLSTGRSIMKPFLSPASCNLVQCYQSCNRILIIMHSM